MRWKIEFSHGVAYWEVSKPLHAKKLRECLRLKVQKVPQESII